MKKSVLVSLLAVLSLASCNNTSNNGGNSTGTPSSLKIAMLTDAGSIDDGSYNQTTWTSIKAYEAANKDKVTDVKYYQPAKTDTAAFEDSIMQAANAGFNTIICPGFYFAEAFEKVAETYPNIHFVGLDFTTATEHKNVSTITYKENESGVLAGYAAVIDGYRKLGFFGGMAQPAPIRYGLGYLYGAYYAAHELGLKDFSINPKYVTYAGKFTADPNLTATGTSWYNDGVDVIFTAAGGAGDSIIAAADAKKNHMIIGVDTDEANKSEAIITSATKGLKTAVFNECDKILKGTFKGGAQTIGIKEDACDVVLGNTARFKNKENTVTKTQAFINTLKAGTVTVPTYTEEDPSLSTFKSGLQALGFTASDALVNAILGQTK